MPILTIRIIHTCQNWRSETPAMPEHRLVDAIRRSAYPLTVKVTDFDPLLKLVGHSRFVLIGEAYRLDPRVLSRARPDH